MVLSPQFQKLTSSLFENLSDNAKNEGFRPNGLEYERSVDLDGSQPAVPKTDFFPSSENLPNTAETNGFEPQGLDYEP